MSKYFEENELAEVVCAMIATFARVCGIQHYPTWEQQVFADRQRYVEGLEELLDMLADHFANQDGMEDPETFDVSIWYRDNWRIFPWAEPDFPNLTHINQAFVLQVAEFASVMAGHYSTEVTEGQHE
uniref:Uncharacterized protein n=1 Tax=Pseudomonas phage HRDY3 TaxID=3236930 RepID=A0AB39CEH1_9VIRU